MRKIVEEEDLDYTPKSIISYKIQQNFILSNMSEKELAIEKRKNELINEIEQKSIIELMRKAEIRQTLLLKMNTTMTNEKMKIWKLGKKLKNMIITYWIDTSILKTIMVMVMWIMRIIVIN